VWAGLALALAINAQRPDAPAPRADKNSQLAHEQLLAKRTQGRIDVYFEGDSITRRWGATDYPQLLQNWKKSFFGWNAADFGWGADRVENILWRLDNGELDGVNPKVVVLLAGTNNIPNSAPEDIALGLKEVLRVLREKAPGAVVVLTAIFPRNDKPEYRAKIDAVNAQLARMADGHTIRFLNVNDKLTEEALNTDKLHPNAKGYQIWADALKPLFTELLGPPAAEDHAPPPTGDPSAH
jgi:lysophospholipase L1-like esterase